MKKLMIMAAVILTAACGDITSQYDRTTPWPVGTCFVVKEPIIVRSTDFENFMFNKETRSAYTFISWLEVADIAQAMDPVPCPNEMKISGSRT